jgi:hypothetical protein
LAFVLTLVTRRTAWGGNFVDKNDVARRVGRFAAGSIALLDFYGDTVDQKVDGRKALIGVKLTAKRPQLVRFCYSMLPAASKLFSTYSGS